VRTFTFSAFKFFGKQYWRKGLLRRVAIITNRDIESVRRVDFWQNPTYICVILSACVYISVTTLPLNEVRAVEVYSRDLGMRTSTLTLFPSFSLRRPLRKMGAIISITEVS